MQQNMIIITKKQIENANEKRICGNLKENFHLSVSLSCLCGSSDVICLYCLSMWIEYRRTSLNNRRKEKEKIDKKLNFYSDLNFE